MKVHGICTRHLEVNRVTWEETVVVLGRRFTLNSMGVGVGWVRRMVEGGGIQIKMIEGASRDPDNQGWRF